MNVLVPNEIVLINQMILDRSKELPASEYRFITYDQSRTLHTLCDAAPRDHVLDTATYYIKNIILLQIFEEANHRTAFECVRLFLHENNIKFKWNVESVREYQRKIFKLRNKIYKTYDKMPVHVLAEPHNELYNYCKEFINNELHDKNSGRCKYNDGRYHSTPPRTI